MRGSRRRILTAAGLALAAPLVPRVRSADASAPLYPRYVPLDVDGLYRKRLRFAAGEPRVSIGLARGRARLGLSGDRPLRLLFEEAGLPKRVFVDRPVVLEPEPSSPGRVRYWVVVDTTSYRDATAAEAAAARWRKRGFGPRVVIRGVVVALAGNVLDTRQRRVLVGGFDDADEARALRQRLFREEGRSVSVEAEPVELPSGRVRVVSEGGDTLHVAAGALAISPAREHAVDVAELGRFAGHLYALADRDGGLTLVNSVGTERMLKGLVPAEIFSHAPAEALKAQAVTARGAVFAKLGHRHFDEPFFLCAEQHCQVYAGVEREHPETSAAIDATRGLLLVRPRAGDAPLELVASVYSSTCGGHSESNEIAWDQAPSPSLRGRLDGPAQDPALAPFAGGLNDSNIRAWVESYPPTYEAKSTFVRADKYRWRVSYSKSEIDGLVASLGVGGVNRLEVLGRGPGGRVTGVRVHGAEGTADVLRELPVRRRFGNLNSGMFVIDHIRDEKGRLERVEIIGGGWGHGVGMCQIGAIGRAEAGQDFRTILAHYYGGAVVERLYRGR
jgi:SpoIID/LytB domain protein